MFYTISYFTIKLSNLPKTKINMVLWLSLFFVGVSFERTRYHTLIKTSKWNNEVTRNSLIINALHICIHILSPCITISSHTCNITAIIRHDLVIINNFFAWVSYDFWFIFYTISMENKFVISLSSRNQG